MRQSLISCLATLLLAGLATAISAAEIRTIAGTGSKEVSGDGGPALQAGTVEPFGLDIGPDGALYWAEFGGQVIRRMDLQTKLVSTYAGVGGKAGYRDGAANQALFDQPHEIRFDARGNLYISDMRTQTIRRIDWQTKQVSTVAGTGKPGFAGDGGPATAALLDYPISVVLDGDAALLICDIKNHRVRRADMTSGIIQTVAGNGEKKPTPDGAPVAGTPLNGPRTLAVEADGNVIIVLREGNAVYRWNRKSNTLHHVAGDGKSGYSGDGGDARLARLSGPKGVAIGPHGDIYLADTESNTIRVIRKASGIIETVIGDGKKGDGPDGDPRKCQLNRPHGVFFDKAGDLYVGDSENNKVRKLTW
jgi:sugar lactone lactonase YvrE